MERIGKRALRNVRRAKQIPNVIVWGYCAPHSTGLLFSRVFHVWVCSGFQRLTTVASVKAIPTKIFNAACIYHECFSRLPNPFWLNRLFPELSLRFNFYIKRLCIYTYRYLYIIIIINMRCVEFTYLLLNILYAICIKYCWFML